MGFVWAVRRSLRLLTLLTLMASALCQGETLAVQGIAAPRAALADSVTDGAGQWPRLDPVATGIFTDDSAATTASAVSPAGVSVGAAFSRTAMLTIAAAAPAPLSRHFCPQAERAPPAA